MECEVINAVRGSKYDVRCGELEGKEEVLTDISFIFSFAPILQRGPLVPCALVTCALRA